MLLRGKKTDLKSGILLALSSLPSNYGIGSLGHEAFRFVDFLSNCRQSYWQLLPLCPIGLGNSPYSSPSSFAGEILYIDIDLLIKDGLLYEEDIKQIDFSRNVDYKKVRNFKLPLLRKAAENFDITKKEFKNFKKNNAYWLDDFALFMAISESFGTKDFTKWADELKYRLPQTLKEFKESHTEEILFFEITQYLFYSQFEKLKEYANSKGVKLIGDIPFYVSFHSADVWSNPDCFKLGRDMTPVLISGVPPDVFSSDGQLWSNPIYDWEHQKKDGFSWWKKRLFKMAEMYDVIRIDHFRAFNDYYTIPFGAKNAKYGKWEKGVGLPFWEQVKPSIKNTLVIAEDLGSESEDVQKLIRDTGFPNMKILQFSFNTDLKNPFLPKNMNRNCVCYTGTHDNDTTLGWYQKASSKEKLLFVKLVPQVYDSVPFNLILFGMKSRAKWVIIPLQDYLELDSAHRMNIPGLETGNWEWRFLKDDITDTLVKNILELNHNRNKKFNRF